MALSRVTATLLTALTCVASVAHADDGEEEVVPMPRHAATLAIAGYSGKLSGLSEGGWGPNLELALGHRRWQYFVELGAAKVSIGPEGHETDGSQVRGGVGVRWLARSFEIDRFGAVEMHLEAITGLEKFWWDDGNRLVRPDLGVGVGYQLRHFGKHDKLAFRLSARVMFAPADRTAATALCRGTCTMPASTSNAGLGAVFGVQW